MTDFYLLIEHYNFAFRHWTEIFRVVETTMKKKQVIAISCMNTKWDKKQRKKAWNIGHAFGPGTTSELRTESWF